MRTPARAPHAALAQLVEHRIRNAGVVGSNPIGGTIFVIYIIILQWLVDLYKLLIHLSIHLLKLAVDRQTLWMVAKHIDED